MMYVHAIVAREIPVPADLEGISGTPVQAMIVRELAAWVCSVDSAPSPTRENLVAHELVVEEIRELAPALPARFGTVLRDEARVREAIEERYDTLIDDLHRIGDKVEMGLTVVGSEAPKAEEPNLGPGARYLRARVATPVTSALRAQAVDMRSEEQPVWPLIFRGAFLIAPEATARFRRAFDELRTARPDLRCLLSGPWPPYTFVT